LRKQGAETSDVPRSLDLKILDGSDIAAVAGIRAWAASRD